MIENDIEVIAKKFCLDAMPDSQINQGASVIIIQNDEIIFTLVKPRNWRKCDYKDCINIDYSGVGGALEEGETPYEALKRELQEEINLDINKLQFVNVDKSYYIKNNKVIKELKLKDRKQNNPLPGYIVDLELPLRTDIKTHGEKRSILQLFVYVAQLDDDIVLNVSEDEEIPALLRVNKEYLSKLLNNKIIYNVKDGHKYINFTWNTNFTNRKPNQILLTPKFTPTGLKVIGWGYEDIKKLI